METTKGKTVFVEYSTAIEGQHFMTVVQNKNHHRIIIGRIYREYDKENKKYKYYATDFANNQIFADHKDLYAIKKQFIEHGENLALSVPVNPNRAKQSGKLTLYINADELKSVREKKSVKDKTKGVSKRNSKAIKKEKSQDSKYAKKYKDVEQKDERDPKENVPERAEFNLEEQQEEQDIASDRMDELEELRDQGDDREQEMEIEM